MLTCERQAVVSSSTLLTGSTLRSVKHVFILTGLSVEIISGEARVLDLGTRQLTLGKLDDCGKFITSLQSKQRAADGGSAEGLLHTLDRSFHF